MSLARCLAVVIGLLAGAPAAWCQGLQMRASEILGREVTTASGERLQIRDLVINPATGKVEYFALGRAGGAPGEALQLHPVEALRSVAGSGLVMSPADQSSSSGASARTMAPRR
ncbi:MAG TPA: PRC-barrel domain-containing protein [Burkholderiales bacterium]|nr:PRC-barrel domain-containing protein [Burkholderiales bacterium]